jgi:hypothetical protein
MQANIIFEITEGIYKHILGVLTSVFLSKVFVPSCIA